MTDCYYIHISNWNQWIFFPVYMKCAYEPKVLIWHGSKVWILTHATGTWEGAPWYGTCFMTHLVLSTSPNDFVLININYWENTAPFPLRAWEGGRGYNVIARHSHDKHDMAKTVCAYKNYTASANVREQHISPSVLVKYKFGKSYFGYWVLFMFWSLLSQIALKFGKK